MASVSSMPPTDQDLKLLLECSICLETFDDPRTLPCLHSFCKKCLENFVDGKRDDELNCPVCRGKFTLNEGVAGMTRNHFICNMVEVLSIQQQNKCMPCSHCEEASVGRCVTCELFMCEKCLKFHNDYPGFKDHVVLTMEELSKPENQSKIKKISKCTQHPNKKVKYYCKTCDQLICRHCMDFDHDKQHNFSPLEQAAQSMRKDLKKNCEILERTVANSDRETRVLKEDIQSLSNNFTMTQRLINERKQQLLTKVHNTVETKTNTMIGDARQIFDGKKKNIEEEIHEKEAFFKRMKVSAEMARSLLENGDDEEIVRSYQSVQENVNNATETEGNRPSYHVDALSWSSDEIDKMLLAEVKVIVEDKGKIEREKPTVDTHGRHGQSGAEPPALSSSDDESLWSWGNDEVPIHTVLPEIVPTLIQQEKQRVETHERHGGSGEELPALGSSDDESLRSPSSDEVDDKSAGGKPRDDQQRRRREQDQKTEGNREEKGNRVQRRDGFNNDNRSPNTISAAPTGRSSQNLPTHSTFQMNIPPQSGTTQAWSPQTTSAPTSLRQVWDPSSHFGTAQAHGLGIQRNMPPTGGAYSSAQSPQHPGYTQQTNQRSPRNRGYEDISQVQAKESKKKGYFKPKSRSTIHQSSTSKRWQCNP